MARLRSNHKRGTLSSAITATDTTISSAGFASLPVVGGGDYMLIVIDPGATAGEPELVDVNAHTSGSNSITSSFRGSEGSTARAHAAGVAWEQVATANDFIASSITFTPAGTTAATNVQAAIAEVALDADVGVTANTGLNAHLVDTVDAHDASAISYAGGPEMSATDVEAALDELAADVVALRGEPDLVVTFSKPGPLSVGAGVDRFYFDRAAEVVNVHGSIGVVAAGQSVKFDVNKGTGSGAPTTMYTTQANRPDIAVGDYWSETTGATALPNVVAIAVGDYLTGDIDQVGSGGAAAQAVSSDASTVFDVGATTFQIPQPAGVVAGDILVCIGSWGRTVTNAVFPLTATGWTRIVGSEFVDNTNAIVMGAIWKVATASESWPQNLSFSDTSGANNRAGALVTLRIAGTSTLDTVTKSAASTAAAGATQTHVVDSVAPTADGLAVLAFTARPTATVTANATLDSAGGVTEQEDVCTALTNPNINTALIVGVKAVVGTTALSTANRTVTYSPSTGTAAMRIAGILLHFLKQTSASPGESALLHVECKWV